MYCFRLWRYAYFTLLMYCSDVATLHRGEGGKTQCGGSTDLVKISTKFVKSSGSTASIHSQYVANTQDYMLWQFHALTLGLRWSRSETMKGIITSSSISATHPSPTEGTIHYVNSQHSLTDEDGLAHPFPAHSLLLGGNLNYLRISSSAQLTHFSIHLTPRPPPH